MSEIQEQIEASAQELADVYNRMKYGLGSTERHSGSEFTNILLKAEELFQEPYRTQMKERFLVLVGLSGDRGRAYDKFLRDFPG